MASEINDEYDVTMLVPRVRVTSPINCGDVTMLSQQRPSLATMTVDEVCVHKIACKKWSNAFVTMNNDFWSLVMWSANDFHSWLRHSWKSLANHLTRDQNSLFTITHALFYI